jgi:hypothetical protein
MSMVADSNGPEVTMVAVKVAVDTGNGGHRLLLSANGTNVETPPIEHMMFFAAIGGMAAAEIIEWPVALVVGAGSLVAERMARQELRGIEPLTFSMRNTGIGVD